MIITDKTHPKFRVCTPIRNMLLANKTISALVDDRIYPVICPEGITGSFILYQRDSYSLESTKMGIYEQNCTVFITCVSSSYDESQEIAEAVFLALQNNFNMVDESTGVVINKIELSDSTEDFVSDKYIQVLKFTIF